MSKEFDELNEERYRLTPKGVIGVVLMGKDIPNEIELAEEIFQALCQHGQYFIKSNEMIGATPVIILDGKGGSFEGVRKE